MASSTPAECSALCKNKNFLQTLHLARNQVGIMIRMANEPLTYDSDRAGRMLGTVLREKPDGTFEYGRVSTDVLYGKEVIANGFTGAHQEIKHAAAILIGVAPDWRGGRVRRAEQTYTRLAEKLDCPIFIMGSGSGAIRKLWVADEDSMVEFLWKK
ncbi:hypothetical protein [Pseudoalteromonas ruthenica]|uniref:Uncharacterized protein n=1 Tax=Pseudoalteromonas ruthenica TaxID=151081 RepID=A0A0F4Q079_9GAMM|nr:hypothetical protein [Pseudoalteromonas ruthenica]KJZ00770.1 hypothetical protein TW76_00720 [Pseudoalteromonas ruthenica]KJZ01177.1 hypothetical protein TW72_04885 [Pseudoalteromonas ruthenica]TMO85658.1 hypothetical protein CWC12_15510 [Pseudoalteromonas ruthenica]TMO92427.1 hypothetical protein CWC13_09825 [Pseudoalteromonas ruthenica]TMO98897.1 hypothetical protein CWC07_09200 [Pseudoalteromonas ruthenica]